MLTDGRLERLVGEFMNARWPEALWPVVNACLGFPLRKSEPGEPLAVRCVSSVFTLRKIALRCAAMQDRSLLADWFRACGQFGFGVKGGTEHVYHASRAAGPCF